MAKSFCSGCKFWNWIYVSGCWKAKPRKHRACLLFQARSLKKRKDLCNRKHKEV